MNTLSQTDIAEGKNLSITCQSNPGNPSATNFYWTKVNNSEFRQNESRLYLPNIQKNSSGTYICVAENNYYNGKKGRNNETMDVNVLCENLLSYKLHFLYDFFYTVTHD